MTKRIDLTFTKLMSRVRKIIPNATVGEDNDGQIVIYTNKMLPWAGVGVDAGSLDEDIEDRPLRDMGEA